MAEGTAGRMHRFDASARQHADRVHDHLVQRMEQPFPLLNGPWTADRLRSAAGRTITTDGLGFEAAFATFTDVLAPATIAMDHPRMLAYVSAAPTVAAELMDSLVAASSIYAGSWLEASGAVHAENEALGWLRSLAGLPEQAGGTFVPGATVGTLPGGASPRPARRTPRWPRLPG